MTEGENILKLIRSRQSHRKYSDKPVEKEKLDHIIEAARMAPSANNTQPWKFIVVTDGNLIKKIAGAAESKLLRMNTFIVQAPVLIVIVRERESLSTKAAGTLKRRNYSLIDIGMAAENICLQAEAEGLGTCIIGWFDEAAIKEYLGVPRSKRIELLVTLGYSLSTKKEKNRKPPEETVSYNLY